jgi:C-terminal processing protease CtpA/Prc
VRPTCFPAGVGILFVEEEDPSGFVRVTVKALIEGGSAEKTGMVKSGDMVVRVGNQDVIGKPLSILRTMIPGIYYMLDEPRT